MTQQRTTRAARPRAATLERRKEILQAALELFGAKGFYNGSLAEIAEVVGMTHAGILHHFGSKNQLLLEVLAYRDQADVEHLENRRMPHGLGLFRHLVHTAFTNATRPGIVQAYAVLSVEAVTDDHPAKDYFVGRYQILRDEVAAAFAVVCADYHLDPADERVRDAAAGILAVMDGLQIQWLLDPQHVNLARASQFALEAMVSAMVDPRPSPLYSDGTPPPTATVPLSHPHLENP